MLFGLTFKAFHNIVSPSQISPVYLLGCKQVGLLLFALINPEFPCFWNFAYLIFLLKIPKPPYKHINVLSMLRLFPSATYQGSFLWKFPEPYPDSIFLISSHVLSAHLFVQTHSTAGYEAVFTGIIIPYCITFCHPA